MRSSVRLLLTAVVGVRDSDPHQQIKDRSVRQCRPTQHCSALYSHCYDRINREDG